MTIRVLRLGKDEKDAIEKVIDSGLLASTLGHQVEEFEKELGTYLEVDLEEVVAVNSGTAALHTLLLAYGIGPGDEVIVPAWTFISTASAVLMCGAKPVFADIGVESFNISPKSVDKSITPKTKAVIAVHLAGIPCEMDELKKICSDNHLYLFEDACQALGAEWDGKKVGTIADGGVFSFYPSKIITTGEGGAISVPFMMADKCRMIRNHGQSKKFHAELLGYNYRMTEIQGALGLVGLKKIKQYIDYQRSSYYDIAKQIHQMGLTLPEIPDKAGIAPTYLPIWSEHAIKEHNWYIPLYKLPLFKSDIDHLYFSEHAYTFGARLPL